MRTAIRNFFVLVICLIAIVCTAVLTQSYWHEDDYKVAEEAKEQQLTKLTNKSIEVTSSSDSVELASYQDEQSAEVAFRRFPTRTVLATGYTAGYESTGKTKDHPQYGITYSGLQVQRGSLSTIAADLNHFPLGTVLYIPDYGYGIVMDIGGAIKGNKIDLYYEDVDDVYNNWGKKEVEVYVIEEGDGSVTEADLNQWEQAISTETVPVVQTN
ncbi:3D domain-containing protein [Alkalibacillus salilacus]|uniref:3D (Asp-Asp-Asp) domain-containing protein n=1 Tax=Alkalibacillus salilacus TaxID=284582 RepID=A0ABT9VEX5_9BACI|nr:3D domain-containing protein [Alkalibacillus salilacus]MDQ0159498.1 3D (Asp-Asp-Asp) domain-containing protein [Alkalibacillus salilacus]